ncbi:L-histidine N(alpha)-methyltransferase, partial [Vibrio parahaemolyticus]
MRQRMKPSDRLLVGLDLLKDRAIIRAAYNDAAGVTAAFNKNLLGRINREFGGEFDLESFAHEAIFDETRQAIEMRL